MTIRIGGRPGPPRHPPRRRRTRPCASPPSRRRLATSTPSTSSPSPTPWRRPAAAGLALDLQPVGVYGAADQLLDLVENGIVDMAWIVNGYTPGRFERSGVIELPFLYETSEEATDAYYTMFEEGADRGGLRGGCT